MAMDKCIGKMEVIIKGNGLMVFSMVRANCIKLEHSHLKEISKTICLYNNKDKTFLISDFLNNIKGKK